MKGTNTNILGWGRGRREGIIYLHWWEAGCFWQSCWIGAGSNCRFQVWFKQFLLNYQAVTVKMYQFGLWVHWKRQKDNVQCEVTWAVIFRCLQPLQRIWNVRNSSELFCFSSQGVIISSALGERSQSVTSPSWLEKILWMLSEAQL